MVNEDQGDQTLLSNYEKEIRRLRKYVCVCVFVRVCMHVVVCMWTYVMSVYVHTYICIYVCMYVHMYACMHT